MKRIIDELIEKCKKLGPICIGIDPRLEYIPSIIKGNPIERILSFSEKILKALEGSAPAVKVNIAFFEPFGPEGIDAFFYILKLAKEVGFITIADVKRGDIGYSSELYAKAYLENPHIDFITVNPYFGEDGLIPFVKLCKKNNKGLFILCKTTNPSSIQIQDRKANGKLIYEIVAEIAERLGKDLIGKYGFSSIGIIAGATFPEQLKKLREKFPSLFFLVPGFGAQGGKPEDIIYAFNEEGIGAIISSSRRIIFAYRYKGYPEREFTGAAKEAVKEMRESILKVLG